MLGDRPTPLKFKSQISKMVIFEKGDTFSKAHQFLLVSMSNFHGVNLLTLRTLVRGCFGRDPVIAG